MRPLLTPLRAAQYAALTRIPLSGAVLDLGGDRRSAYERLFSGSFRTTTVNLDAKAQPDIVHDLETPLPIRDTMYDHVLLINLLEHIYAYKQLLAESSRVLKPGGTLVIAVPFLYPVHFSPHDYRRFTEEALRRECADVGLDVLHVEPLGTGPFCAQLSLLLRVTPRAIRGLLASLQRPWVGLDRLFAWLARTNRPEHYALGYVVRARKPEASATSPG